MEFQIDNNFTYFINSKIPVLHLSHHGYNKQDGTEGRLCFIYTLNKCSKTIQPQIRSTK
jgi:hypothetical protein